MIKTKKKKIIANKRINTKKKLSNKFNKINKINQEGGYREVDEKFIFDYKYKLSNSNIDNSRLRDKIIDKNKLNPEEIFKILQHLKCNKKNYIIINNTSYFLKDLKICKIRIKIDIVHHFSLLIYIEDRMKDQKYVLFNFGGYGTSYNNFFMAFPDLDFSEDKEFINNEIITLTISKDILGKNDSVQINENNLDYLLTLVYILKFSHSRCLKCNTEIDFKNRVCFNCNKVTFGRPITTLNNKLFYYRKKHLKELETSYSYHILYGKYSLILGKGINCQTFANLFINLMKGIPFSFSVLIRHNPVIKRIQCLKYFYDINRLFLEKNNKFMSKDDIAMFKNVNNYYIKYLHRLNLERYCFYNIELKGKEVDDTIKFGTFQGRKLLKFIKKSFKLGMVDDINDDFEEDVEEILSEEPLNSEEKKEIEILKVQEKTKPGPILFDDIEDDIEAADLENENFYTSTELPEPLALDYNNLKKITDEIREIFPIPKI
jgi:hypothetical protein